MIKQIFVIFFLFAARTASAQTNPSQLYPFIKSIVPDSVMPDQLGDWTLLKTIAMVKWERLNCDSKTCLSDGQITLTPKAAINDSATMAWPVMVTGLKSGYDEINVSSTWANFSGNVKSLAGLLLGKNDYKAVVYKQCKMDSNGFSYISYKVSIPGKKSFYLLFMTGTTNTGNGSLDIWIYLNKYKGPTVCK